MEGEGGGRKVKEEERNVGKRRELEEESVGGRSRVKEGGWECIKEFGRIGEGSGM